MPQAPHLIIDFETRSELDLKKVGIWRYVNHPSTRILCFAIKYEGRREIFYDPDILPGWLFQALLDEDVEIHAHNAAVERLIMQIICAKRHGWPWVDTDRFRCSAARVSRMAIPRKLEKAAPALAVPVSKDMEGHRVMLRISKPLNHKKFRGQGFVYDDDPAKLKRVGEYCGVDVDVEGAIIDATFPMPEREEHYYQLTERINDRGVKVDVDLVKRLIWRANECTEDLNTRLQELTRGNVRALTEVAKLKTWVEEETGVVLQTLRKEDMEGLLDEAGTYDFPSHVIEALKIRQEGAKSSVSKLVAILNRVADDGRLRHAFVFNGASTGRYTSMGVQLQNLVRETLKDFENAIKRLDEFTLVEISKCIRACFIPEKGYVYVDADYNAIEARGVGWLAGASRLLGIYERGGDPYCDMGTVIYNREITKADTDERFVGKQTILGCGYGMGDAKFHSQCIKFGKEVSHAIAKKAIRAYRDEFSEIPELWYDMEAAAIAAVRKPGRITEIPNGKIQFRFAGGYLQMRLPSGRRLFYKAPRVTKVEGLYGPKWELSYMAEHPITKQWVRETTWGGKLTENAVQALCRDLLFRAMDILEFEYEIPVVLSVHDQIVVEVLEEDGPWAMKIVKKVMESLPDWAAGFPIFAEPKIATRFGK